MRGVRLRDHPRSPKKHEQAGVIFIFILLVRGWNTDWFQARPPPQVAAVIVRSWPSLFLCPPGGVSRIPPRRKKHEQVGGYNFYFFSWSEY